MSGQSAAASTGARTAAQRSCRRRVRQLDLTTAVRRAVDGLFRFTHRANNAKALWSQSGAVWLGRTTFLHWALDDTSIDIPWVIAGVADAPEPAAELRAAVKSELTAYWTDLLGSLPRKSTGNWLPLP